MLKVDNGLVVHIDALAGGGLVRRSARRSGCPEAAGLGRPQGRSRRLGQVWGHLATSCRRQPASLLERAHKTADASTRGGQLSELQSISGTDRDPTPAGAPGASELSAARDPDRSRYGVEVFRLQKVTDGYRTTALARLAWPISLGTDYRMCERS